MNVLLKSVRIVETGNALNGKVADIYIENGIIKSIESGIDKSAVKKDTLVFDVPRTCISTGWMDMRCRFTEPGNEQKETIASGLSAAAAGGFTAVLMMPSTLPPVDERSAVEYILTRGKGSITTIYPAGCLTVRREGKEMAGMYDMKLGGAVAFTDDKRSITDSGVLVRLLQYCGNIGSPVLLFADDKSISGDMQANESYAATLLGFKGSPALAEEIAVMRDILVGNYTGVNVHLTGISTKEAVGRIREAKQKGMRITCETASHYLLLNDDVLDGFDTNYKVKPPLRTAADVDALCKAIGDGTIDVIVSDHTPEDAESKHLEWDFAAHGIASLETTFGVMHKALADTVSLENLINTITVNPRKILGIDVNPIVPGGKAEFTLFNTGNEWTYNVADNKSLARNSPFHGYTFGARPVAVYNNNMFQVVES